MANVVRKSQIDVYELEYNNGSSTDNVTILINCADKDVPSELYDGGKYGVVQLSGSNIDTTGTSTFNTTNYINVTDLIDTEIVFSTKRNGNGALVVTIPSDYLNHDENLKPEPKIINIASESEDGVVKLGTNINPASKLSLLLNHQSIVSSTLLTQNLLFDFPSNEDKAIQLPLVLDDDNHAYTLLNKKFLNTDIYDYTITAEYDDQTSTESVSNYTSNSLFPTEDSILTVRFNDVRTTLIKLNNKTIYYSLGSVLDGNNIGAINGLDFLITLEYNKLNDNYNFINCHRIDFLEGGEYVSIENGVVDLTKHHQVISKKKIIESLPGSVGYIWNIKCFLNDVMLKVANVKDYYNLKYENPRHVIYKKTNVGQKEYAGFCCINATSLSGAYIINIHDETNDNDLKHFICFIMDTGTDFTDTFITSLTWNFVCKFERLDQMRTYLELPEDFKGTVEFIPIGTKISSGGYWFAKEAIQDGLSCVLYENDGLSFEYQTGTYMPGSDISTRTDVREPYGRFYTSLIVDLGNITEGLWLHDIIINDAILHLIEYKLLNIRIDLPVPAPTELYEVGIVENDQSDVIDYKITLTKDNLQSYSFIDTSNDEKDDFVVLLDAKALYVTHSVIMYDSSYDLKKVRFVVRYNNSILPTVYSSTYDPDILLDIVGVYYKATNKININIFPDPNGTYKAFVSNGEVDMS